MEVAGLTLSAVGVFECFKEVYLLSKFIARLVASAKNVKGERDDLDAEFRFEFLYLRSTGLFFLQTNGVVNNDGLNRVSLPTLQTSQAATDVHL